MWQPYLSAIRRISTLAQPVQMRCQRLANSLVIVEHANLAAYELTGPDSAGVRLGSRSANVQIKPDCHQWISGNAAYWSFGGDQAAQQLAALQVALVSALFNLANVKA